MPNRRPVIVIDPGHGGSEKIGGSSPNNAAGANGMLEKNLTLDIARRMASVLKDSARVLLTRNDDVNLSLAERANLARRNDAAIFLSLHFNGFKDRNVDGAETFVASRAGSSSERLARQVLDHLVNVTQGANRGVKRADLGVLLPDRHLPQTAACLAEIAFLTNPAQAKKLEDAAYRQQIAAALGDAILISLSSSSFSAQSLSFDYENGHSDSRYFRPPDYYPLGDAPKFEIKESVGKGGANKPGDVFAAKRRLIELGFDWITLDKKMDAETIHAIRLFQSIVNDSKTLSGDGKIDVGANTYKWLQAVNAPRWRKMPKGSTGEGFINFEYSDENIHIYGTDWLADTLAGAGIHYRDNYLKSHPTAALLTVNDASLARGGKAPPHSEHQTGMDCDLRLPRTDGKTGGINIGKPAELLLFDRNAARAILQALKAQPLVSRLLFNDQTLIDEGLCKKSTPDHNHHIHVDISPPAIVNDLKHYRSGGRLYQGSHQDDIDYQTRALDANCDNSVEVKRDEKYLEFAPMSRESDRPNKKENVFLRWCDIPKNRCEVDVVVHFHGWDIRTKKTAFFEFAVNNSGLDLLKPDNTLTRQRPTLCILPFGKGEKMPDPDNRIKYTFPFLTSKDGLRQLIDFSLKYIADRYKSAFTIGRLILTAHSGGGAAVSSILQKLSNGSLVLGKKDVDEVHLFDSTYGDQQSFIDWAANKINTSETSAKSGALRVLYQPFGGKCKESGTIAGSRQIEKGISDKTKKYPGLNSRYRVQPTRIEHLSIPKIFGFQLLADAGADLDDSVVNENSVHPCCQKSPAKCGVKELVRPQSSSFEGWGKSRGMRVTAGLDVAAGRDLDHARAMDAPKPGSAPMFIEENLLKDHPLSTGLIVVASKKGKKKSKASVAIKESPSVFVPQILRLAAKMAGDEKRADLAAQLAPNQWFTRFTRSIALPGGKTDDLTFLGRKLKQGQYIHVELAKTLQRIEDLFVKELNSSAKDAGDILLLKSDEGISGTRAKSSTAKYSYHMFGLAVDVNYLGNPFIQSGAIETVNRALKNAASLMSTEPLAYAHNTKGKFKDRFDYIQAMDSLLERYFGLLDDQTGLDRYLSGSSEWRMLSTEAAKQKIQTDLDELSGAVERGDAKDDKRKDYFKKHAILDFDKRFVLGMERMGLSWGGHYGDMMHFDMRNTGVGAYISRGIAQYQKDVNSLAESLFSKEKYGVYKSDGQPVTGDRSKPQSADAIAAGVREFLLGTTQPPPGEALETRPAISNTARLEWQDLTMAPGIDGQNHLYYLTSGGPEGSPAIFNLKVTNTNSVYNLENAVLKVRLSKKLSDGSFKTISMRGQTGEYKSIRSQSIEDESSRVIPIKIERETLLNAYKADPDSPFTRLEVEFHWTEGAVSPSYHYNRHSLAFFLVRPFEFLFNTKKLVRDVKLNDLQYRSYWTGIWEKEFSSADQTPLTVVTTIQTSVSESGTDEITMSRSTTEAKGVQRGVESSYSSTSKASFGLEDVVKIGLEQQESVSVKTSINRSESIARQFSESLRSSRAFTQAFTKTLQVTSQISPAGADKIKTLYVYPIFDLYKVKLVRYEGPNRLGQATRRTEIVDVPVLLFSHWGDKQVQTDAKPARSHSLAASSLSAEEWLPTVCQTLEQFLYRFANMTVNVSGSSVAVRPPYFINRDNDRKRRALENRRNAPREDKEIFEQQRFAAARVGKPSINQLQEILQLAIDRGRIVTSGGLSRPNADDYRQWLARYGLGIDCSGFVTQALNQTSSRVFGRDLNKSETLDPLNVNSAALKGSAPGFTTVARPDQLRPGDTMHKPGHIRVVTRVEITAEGHVKFTTAESSSVNDIGPTHNVWRYRDRSQFSGLQKEGDRDWKGSRWENVNEQDTFGRYALLARFIEANPVAREQSHVWRDHDNSAIPFEHYQS